ncbi:MAG: mechanosensitive ion channel family protein [Candidatus Woesearchaeota archaeon]
MLADFSISEFMRSEPGNAFIVVGIILVTVIVQRIVKKYLEFSFTKNSLHLNIDNTQFALLKHSFTPMIYVIGIGAAIYFIPPLRSLSISLFAGAGLVAIVIGFAAQKTFANVISGISIATSKPFRVGDLIEVGERRGYVEDITLRHTIIRGFRNERYVLPNSLISEDVIENFTLEETKICRFVEMGISYDSDIDKAMQIIREEAEKHPRCIDTRTLEEVQAKRPKVVVRLIDFGDSSVNLRGYVWARDPVSAFLMGCDLNVSIKKRFDAEGIEIPLPYRTIVYKEKSKKQKVVSQKKKVSTAKKKSAKKTVARKSPKKTSKKANVKKAVKKKNSKK